MKKISSHGNYTVLILCVVMFGILLSATYIFAQKYQSVNIDTLNKDSDDFNFRLNFEAYGKCQIDTYKGTFTKDLILDGSKTIDFKIPDNVKKDIYKLMMDINILSFPDTLKVDGMAVTPACDYELTVTIKGKTKTIIWKEGFHPFMNVNLPKENENFLKLVEYISNYIYSTEEYKKMPKSKGYYD